MAKLSARNRVELARVSKETTMPNIVPCDSCNQKGTYDTDLSIGDIKIHSAGSICIVCGGVGEKKPSTSWEKLTRTLMSDGKVLEKWVVRFQADNFHPKGRLHDYGWKVRGKAKPGLTSEQFISIYTLKGWKVEK